MGEEEVKVCPNRNGSVRYGCVMDHPDTQCLKTINIYYCLWIYGLSQGVLLLKVELTHACVVSHRLSRWLYQGRVGSLTC